MRIGVVLDGRRSAAEIAELARLAETCGFSTVWLSAGARTKDHFVRLARARAATRRIRLGPIAVSPFEMHPVHIGLALLTLDEIAPGRACLVPGAGGDLAATLDPPKRGRVEAVEECLDILRAQAAGGEINYAGKHYRVTRLFSPWSRVVMDRLYLGANRPRMLRLGARKADGVMVTDMPLAYLGPLIARIRTELAEANRDPRTFAVSNWFVWNVQETRAEAERLARRQLGFRLYYIREIASSIGLGEAEARQRSTATEPPAFRDWRPADVVSCARRAHDQTRPPDDRGDQQRQVTRLVYRDARAQARVRDSRAAYLGRAGRVRLHAVPRRDARGAGAPELRPDVPGQRRRSQASPAGGRWRAVRPSATEDVLGLRR